VSSAELTPESARRPFTGRRVRFGDVLLQLVAGLAAAAATALVFLIAWKVVEGARPAIAKYGLHFITDAVWNPVVGREAFGAASFLFGTAITSLFALATFSYASFSTIANVLPTDLYKSDSVATVSGLSGTAAGIGTIIAFKLIGHFSDARQASATQ